MSKVNLGKKSVERLESVNERLQRVIRKAFETMPFDITVIEGIRSAETQKEYVRKGASKTYHSRHLTGHAIDMAPYPVDWNDLERFAIMAEHVLAASKALEIPVKWGGTWSDSTADWKSTKFFDGPHFELV